jgi:hypothetical protein
MNRTCKSNRQQTHLATGDPSHGLETESHSLGSLVVGLGGILQVAGVLDGNGLADSRTGTASLLEDGLGNTHIYDSSREGAES